MISCILNNFCEPPKCEHFLAELFFYYLLSPHFAKIWKKVFHAYQASPERKIPFQPPSNTASQRACTFFTINNYLAMHFPSIPPLIKQKNTFYKLLNRYLCISDWINFKVNLSLIHTYKPWKFYVIVLKTNVFVWYDR